ncbi:FAD-dependent oxidoreductase [Haloarcula marina]|uniref:FAD-dependent oxidoreductase n=1 Tax=Haloarcula marina TaxID=2961574 RepID=UPI0020B86E98|nr:FAD-dependent oxidoreductase [Halomicroarcula marina]
MTNDVNFPVVVAGGTPGGIAAAVRSAREGQETLLVTYNDHLGGMMASGLSYTDTITMKTRAPILEELVSTVERHYRETYGSDSDELDHCFNGYLFEPHIVEDIFEDLVEDESKLTVRRGYKISNVERDGTLLEQVTFESFETGERFTADADVFVEATYEGDLAATAGVPYRLGRESTDEFDEEFAGRIFTTSTVDRYFPRDAVGEADPSVPADHRGPLDVPPEKRQGELDVIPHPCGLNDIFPSTGEADDAIQAYSYRLCLSCDPENRRYPEKPPEYDREEYLSELDNVGESGFMSFGLRLLPNDKADMNYTDLVGESHEYPEADWDRRKEIADRHRNYALGLIYFLQNDEAVPEDLQADAREWGLAKDEFVDNDNFPWQFYVREARRIEGRTTFTENDARIAPGLDRTPINEDSIAIAEYPIDSHACRTESRPGSPSEGGVYASQITRPSQVPYRSILAKGVQNLLVPVPLSATHIGWGTIRLEPTWMHIGESAGLAAALALETDREPSALDVGTMQRELVDRGVMLSFFNEFDMATDEEWVDAVQYLGTLGYFESYNANPDELLSRDIAHEWAQLTATIRAGESVDPTAIGTKIHADADQDGPSISSEEFVEVLAATFTSYDLDVPSIDGDLSSDPITRGEACCLVYDILDE